MTFQCVLMVVFFGFAAACDSPASCGAVVETCQVTTYVHSGEVGACSFPGLKTACCDVLKLVLASNGPEATRPNKSTQAKMMSEMTFIMGAGPPSQEALRRACPLVLQIQDAVDNLDSNWDETWKGKLVAAGRWPSVTQQICCPNAFDGDHDDLRCDEVDFDLDDLLAASRRATKIIHKQLEAKRKDLEDAREAKGKAEELCDKLDAEIVGIKVEAEHLDKDRRYMVDFDMDDLLAAERRDTTIIHKQLEAKSKDLEDAQEAKAKAEELCDKLDAEIASLKVEADTLDKDLPLLFSTSKVMSMVEFGLNDSNEPKVQTLSLVSGVVGFIILIGATVVARFVALSRRQIPLHEEPLLVA